MNVVVTRSMLGSIPVFHAPVPCPVNAALFVRVGTADERPPIAGVTHVVEHLALSGVGRPRFTLQRLAAALGVLLSDLTGNRPPTTFDTTPELLSFAASAGLPAADVDMLASIRFRGQPPQSEERWRYIYNAIRSSENLDGE
jgi:hypothetical protein